LLNFFVVNSLFECKKRTEIRREGERERKREREREKERMYVSDRHGDRMVVRERKCVKSVCTTMQQGDSFLSE